MATCDRPPLRGYALYSSPAIGFHVVGFVLDVCGFVLDAGGFTPDACVFTPYACRFTPDACGFNPVGVDSPRTRVNLSWTRVKFTPDAREFTPDACGFRCACATSRS
eukprot:6079544-Pyramimonas_sp.AAC.1